MKTIKSYKYLAMGLLAACALTQSGCSSDYMDTVPTESAALETVTSSLDNLYVALNGIHRKMVSQDQGNQGMGGEPGHNICREALGDDMTWDTQSWHKGFLNWSYPTNATTSYNYNFWETYYKFILNANMILDQLDEKFADSAEPLAKHIKGEALVIRAWSHFQLVQMYAKPYRNGQGNTQLGVPYRLKANTDPMARNTVEEVYSQINADLDEAIQLLTGYEANDINHYT
ncbi:MAG: RagB/SusD family nutrient uptake outer membrane protein, partial [Parabacteroides sp.]|nr:RagB/SusD family nutrient uptake outer membrane protein [Parabacteroides sp.]